MRASMRILVCDDNKDSADTLAALCRVLSPQSEVKVSYSGIACADAAPAWHPDLLFLDIGMPGMSGYDVARQLRALKECCATVIVAVSGWAAKADRERSAAAGFDCHFAKPIDAGALQEMLEKGRT
jgi:CheY-like chemotaxis protein